MATVLITGANRGLGLEFARQYVADGWQVIACCRQPEQAQDLRALGVRCERLDVADFASIGELAHALQDQEIDVLLNNAGLMAGEGIGALNVDQWRKALDVNVIAPAMMAEAFVNHVARSQRKIIAVVSSLMGSMADNSSGGYYGYRSAKAGVNAVVKNLSIDLASRGINAVALHPGWVRTDMGGPEAPLSAQESVAGLRRVLNAITQKDSGQFFDYMGQKLPW